MKLSKNVISLLTIISLILLTIGAVSAADTNDTGLDDVISDIADINTTTPEISPNKSLPGSQGSRSQSGSASPPE